MPILYSFRRCPYAMRARMALLASGVDYQTVEVSLRNKPPALLAISPKGTVPVMQLADGTVLEQSIDIMRWALAVHDPKNWLRAGDSRADAQIMNEWILLCDITFKPLLDRYKYWNRHAELSQEVHRERALEGFIRKLNTSLTFGGFVLGNQPSMADVAIFPFVRQFAAVDPIWFDSEPLTAVQFWLAKWLDSDLFERCMAKLN